MKLGDIIELAKQGYTPNDIKELLSLNITEQEVKTTEQEKQPVLPDQAKKDAESEHKNATEKKEESREDSINYKLLYEDAQKKLEAAQKSNTNKNVQPENTKTDSDLIAEIVAGFM